MIRLVVSERQSTAMCSACKHEYTNVLRLTDPALGSSQHLRMQKPWGWPLCRWGNRGPAAPGQGLRLQSLVLLTSRFKAVHVSYP